MINSYGYAVFKQENGNIPLIFTAAFAFSIVRGMRKNS